MRQNPESYKSIRKSYLAETVDFPPSAGTAPPEPMMAGQTNERISPWRNAPENTKKGKVKDMIQKETIKIIANLSNEKQNEFYNNLRNSGFSNEEIKAIQCIVFTYKIYNDQYLYETIVQSMAEQMYVEFNS